jgi:dephospho-CoA kinase
MEANDRHAAGAARGRRGLRIGLTGGIASGKSEVGRILEKEGAAVLDTDEVAHDLVRSGTPVFREVVEWFGQDIVGADGEIDRAVLGAKVFADPRARRALEAIVHPHVIRVLRGWLEDVTATGRDAVALVPLLFEVEVEGPWDAVICVVAPEEAVLERLRRRGLSAEDARRRMSAQMPAQEKARRSDYVVSNEGSLDSLAGRTRELWKNILEKERNHHGRPETRKA